MRNGSERGIAKLRQPVKPVPSAVNVEAAGGLDNYGNGGLKLEAGHDAAIEGAIVAAILAAGLDGDVGIFVSAMDADMAHRPAPLRLRRKIEGRTASELRDGLIGTAKDFLVADHHLGPP